MINAFDKRSLTEAVRLRSLHGGEITAITMGPPQARDALVECLGRGVDRAVHICDPEIAELSSQDVLEKFPQAVSSGCDGSRRESPFHLHVPAESIDFLLVRSRNTVTFH